MSASFRAQFSGRCGSCGEPIDVGDDVFYDGVVLAGMACCAGDDDILPSRLFSEPPRAHVAPDPTLAALPRGKTKRDACPRCFIVPASNGECACL